MILPTPPFWGLLLIGIGAGAALDALARLWLKSDGRARILLHYALLRWPWLTRWIHARARPAALLIEGTNICNAECVFCAYPQMQRPKTTMPMEIFKKAVDEWTAMGQTVVGLTPIVGDPLLDRHLFERLDDLFSRPTITGCHFFTNAIFMRPDMPERLAGYGRRLTLLFSIGGFDRETYGRIMGVDRFDEVSRNMKLLVEAKARLNSGMNLEIRPRAPKAGEKGEFWDYLKKIEAEGLLRMGPSTPYDNWGGQIAEETLREAGLPPAPAPAHRGPCRHAITGPVVLADGRVNACCCRDVEATLVIGDLKVEPLNDILSGSRLTDLLKRQARGDFPEACRRCTFYESVYSEWLPVI